MATLAVLLFPVGTGLFDVGEILHGARPLNDVIHRAGFWALIFLGLALAVTPLRRIGRFSALIDVRRMIGVASFFYV
ncbi:MAG: sulfoxide reductase heme-binding subunit YedZ, partial [Pseudolabrys sp.]|nr:sulfoxide reductase heme-binding subunit YedZ [Pseudolabrys sp.]